MADVKWIKIVTDIFDDEKILLIESLPESDGIIVIWFKLLCLAGKNNNSGVFILNEKISYTDEMFSTIFRRPINTVRLALKTFQDFGMIEVINGAVTIPNWGKHQSLDQLENKKEYMRGYMREYREKQKQITDGKSSRKTNSKSNVSSLDKNRLDKNRLDKKENKTTEVDGDIPISEQKHKYGNYGWVKLTDEEYNRLLNDFGLEFVEHYINYIDESAQQTGNKNKWKDWNLTIRKAIKNKWGEQTYGRNQQYGKEYTEDKPKYGNVL